jgi:hypothetical protein
MVNINTTHQERIRIGNKIKVLEALNNPNRESIQLINLYGKDSKTGIIAPQAVLEILREFEQNKYIIHSPKGIDKGYALTLKGLDYINTLKKEEQLINICDQELKVTETIPISGTDWLVTVSRYNQHKWLTDEELQRVKTLTINYSDELNKLGIGSVIASKVPKKD